MRKWKQIQEVFKEASRCAFRLKDKTHQGNVLKLEETETWVKQVPPGYLQRLLCISLQRGQIQFTESFQCQFW